MLKIKIHFFSKVLSSPVDFTKRRRQGGRRQGNRNPYQKSRETGDKDVADEKVKED